MEYKLSEVTKKIGSGATPRGGSSSYLTSGIPLIRSLNIYDLKFNYKDLAYISEGQAQKLNNVIVEKGDVLINITGASVARCTSVPDELVPARVNQHVAILRADEVKLHSIYLKYLLVSSTYKSTILSIATTGATREALTKNNLENLKIDILHIKTQRAIANILNTYDHLIQNNEKRIKILEEMAERLYTEWFVKFKFPGHEKVKMVESGTEYGKIPEGWEVRKVHEFAKVTMGQSPKSIHYNTEGKGLPFHQGVSDFGNHYPTDRIFSTGGNKYAEREDLLFSVRAPVGRMNIANKKIILGRGLSSISHKERLQSLLFCMFSARFTVKDMIGNGAIYKSVNKSEIENLKFVCSTDAISKSFEKIVSVYFYEIANLTNQIIHLQEMRDLLIPQLVTGRRELKG